MFDWFRTIALEAKGIDSSNAISKRELKRQEAKKNRFIFSKKMKVLIIILGVLYMIIAVTTAVFEISEGNMSLRLVVSFFLCLLDIAIIVSLIIGKRTGEIAALAGIILFFLGIYVSAIIPLELS